MDYPGSLLPFDRLVAQLVLVIGSLAPLCDDHRITYRGADAPCTSSGNNAPKRIGSKDQNKLADCNHITCLNISSMQTVEVVQKKGWDCSISPEASRNQDGQLFHL